MSVTARTRVEGSPVGEKGLLEHMGQRLKFSARLLSPGCGRSPRAWEVSLMNMKVNILLSTILFIMQIFTILVIIEQTEALTSQSQAQSRAQQHQGGTELKLAQRGSSSNRGSGDQGLGGCSVSPGEWGARWRTQPRK